MLLLFFSILARSEEHTSELQSHLNLVCRLLLEKKMCVCVCVVGVGLAGVSVCVCACGLVCAALCTCLVVACLAFMVRTLLSVFVFFFFIDTATAEIYSLSLHDALPIFSPSCRFSFVSFLLRVVSPSFVSFLRSEEHMSELQSHLNLVCRLLLEQKT